MSPATKSKSKDKKAGKDVVVSKPLGSVTSSSGVPSSAYNPLMGTFHTLDTVPDASTINGNVRFRSIDEMDVGGVEYDLVSNNDSWSGESEDHKDKTSSQPVRHETIPGADNDKREKIRLKNERKHQRQREKRAQELHDRCSGYLMSRKLDALAQQLIAMGFSQERATMALMLNEGKVEQSVAWLFDANDNTEMSKDPIPGNLKIDITEELSRISDLEIRFKCTKQEVERAIVAAEGDIEKAQEALAAPKQDPPKLEESGDPPTSSYGKLPVGMASQNPVRLQPRPVSSFGLQQKRDEKDFNYTKAPILVGESSESVTRSVPQPLKRIQQKLDWPRPLQNAPVQNAEKRWTSGGSNPPGLYSLPPSQQPSPTPTKNENWYNNVPPGNEFKQPSIREPVMMMQRSQAIKNEQLGATSISSSHGTAAHWYPTSNVEIMKSNGLMTHNPNTNSPSPNNLTSHQMYQRQLYYQQQQQQQQRSLGDIPGVAAQGNGRWNRNGASPTIAAASSLGLFSGLGSNGSWSGPSVDWNTTGSLAHLDYCSIDWSLDRSSSFPRSNGSWMGSNSSMYDSHINVANSRPAIRQVHSNNGVGLQDGGLLDKGESSSAREWTSPFEEKDLFSVPRKFVYPPL